jgi:hypothetical protein
MMEMYRNGELKKLLINEQIIIDENGAEKNNNK